jgi:hypothetical protein
MSISLYPTTHCPELIKTWRPQTVLKLRKYVASAVCILRYRDVGRCRLLCATQHFYGSATTNEWGTYTVMCEGYHNDSSANKRNRDARTRKRRGSALVLHVKYSYLHRLKWNLASLALHNWTKRLYRVFQNLCHKLFLGIPHPHLSKNFPINMGPKVNRFRDIYLRSCAGTRFSIT